MPPLVTFCALAAPGLMLVYGLPRLGAVLVGAGLLPLVRRAHTLSPASKGSLPRDQ